MTEDTPAEPISALTALDDQSMRERDFDELESILDEMRTRYDETPQWEFCEGFMAALICCRRNIPQSEYLPVLLGLAEAHTPIDIENPVADEGSFANTEQAIRFTELWSRRWNEVADALDEEVDNLQEDVAYHPEVMDVRGAVADMPPDELLDIDLRDENLPSLAQVWALGFMYAVECWPDEWAPPRDRETAEWLDEALQSIVAMTEDDTDPPTVAVFSTDGTPTVSRERIDAFGEAIWAVYDLRELWRSLGPRVETVRKAPAPGRNDLCPCGSGKKYKKCHGAG